MNLEESVGVMGFWRAHVWRMQAEVRRIGEFYLTADVTRANFWKGYYIGSLVLYARTR